MSYNYAVASSPSPLRSGSSLRQRSQPDRRMLLVMLIVPLILSLAAYWVFDRGSADRSPLLIANLIGPTADGLLHGQGLTFCTEDMGTFGNPICFHAARMPLPSVVVALGVKLLGNHYLPVALLKVLLLLLPLEAAFFLVWLHLPRSHLRQALIVALLLLPFLMTPLLADVVNLQVEEGYTYSFLALAVAILFFTPPRERDERHSSFGPLWAILFALSSDAIYLAKSSMALVTLVLTIAFVFQERRAGLRLLVLLLVAAAPVSWALHQHHASGRYSVGTSIDGFNLRKGNNEAFLERYPPPPGETLDKFDPLFNEGIHFPDEWSFNDFHQRAAITYLRTHQVEALRGGVRKFVVLFLTVRKIGSADSQGLLLGVEIGGLILFRILLWVAISCSVYGIWKAQAPGSGIRRGWVPASRVFLVLVGACTVPYIVGFGYTRHVSILIYPAALMCCAVMADESVEMSIGDDDLPA